MRIETGSREKVVIVREVRQVREVREVREGERGRGERLQTQKKQ